jgi:hypothetical protein
VLLTALLTLIVAVAGGVARTRTDAGATDAAAPAASMAANR